MRKTVIVITGAFLVVGLTGCGKSDADAQAKAEADAKAKQFFKYEDPRKGVHFQTFSGGSADFKPGTAPGSAQAASKGASQ